MTKEFRVTGTVIEEGTGRPLPNLVVRAFDKDRLYDDLLGSDRTDESGRFEMRYAGSDFEELFEKHPDIYFEVLDPSGQNTIHSTEESVRWDAGADEQFIIEIPQGLVPRAAGAVDEKRDGVDDADKRMLPYLLSPSAERMAEAEVKVNRAQNPLPRATLGDIGRAAEITGERLSAQSILILPLDEYDLIGIDESTVRVFRADEESGTLRPVWNSGVNTALGFAWAKVTRPGVYVPIGLPRDRLLQELLREVARERRLSDTDSHEETERMARDRLSLFHEESPEIIEAIRAELARVEAQTITDGLPRKDTRYGHGRHILPIPLPRDAEFKEFAERIRALEFSRDGLPEEQLFYPPDAPRLNDLPWPVAQDRRIDDIFRHDTFEQLKISRDIASIFPFLFSKNWWMYQHDERHTGRASGHSDIRSTTVGTLVQQSQVAVEGTVYTKPSIVDGYIYIGTSTSGGSDKAILYKIELATGNIVGKFEVTGTSIYPVQGIGGSPAVVDGKVYFSSIYGQIYCLDASTMNTSPTPPAPLWVTNLKASDMGQNQPVNNPDGDSWSGPLVVNGNVYVGSGEGEADIGKPNPNTYGFIWCLDANTGHVKWLFCTNKFTSGAENSPNTIPSEAAAPWAASHGFTVLADPPQTGNAVWSSCVYDSVTRRIFVGTGNSQYNVAPGPGDGTAQPDFHYGSGLLSLDADTGEFRGFFQPAVDDCYWDLDSDIDVPGSATVYTQGGRRVVGFGSKNGSYFLLDAHDLSIIARRQLLPRNGGSGLPGDRGTGIPSVVPTSGSGENKWGVMGTAALHSSLHTLFIALGGYADIDGSNTPFMRSVDWETLIDKWATAVSGGVSRYTVPVPPMYTTDESGLSSPATVNDVVFVSTDKAALYALDAATGLCLWSAPHLPTTGFIFSLGPAIYGNYVVNGADHKVYIYKLPPAFVHIPWDRYLLVNPFPWPPEPDPRLKGLIDELRTMLGR